MTNRSLSAIEPVSATAKRKLENGEQRPAPETYPARAEIPKITGQRLGSASVTRGNVAGSHTPGNITPETRLPGWANWIRTKACTLYASLLADEKPQFENLPGVRLLGGWYESKVLQRSG